MAHTLPPLPYAYNALEPHIDEMTMRIHHTKHHQTYVEKLNAALAKHPALEAAPLAALLADLSSVPDDIRSAVRNHGGGHVNHTFFWECMTPESTRKPAGELALAIDQGWGSFAAFQEAFTNSALAVFGSGWTWLVLANGKLAIVNTPNQDNPLSQGVTPILGIDLWEHGYYLLRQSNRAAYVQAWWNVVNWAAVAQRFTSR